MTSSVTVERLFRSSKTLHRTTQELSMQAAELAAALTRDDSARFQQAVAAQQRVRMGAAIVLAVAVILIRTGDPLTILIATIVGGAYAVGAMYVGGLVARSEMPTQRNAVILAASDAIAVTTLCALASAGGATEALVWILIAGSLAAPSMAFAFGGITGTVSLATFAGGYVLTTVIYVGFHIGTATGATSSMTLVLWGAGVWLLIRHFTSLRHRLDWLRTYAKLAEVGDIGNSDMISTSEGSDDFALLARSFEAVHSRLYEQIGSDPLTGCANRRGLEKQLLGVCRLARRRSEFVAVAAIDIDHFKAINDTHGHPEGDRVLRQLATIMMNTARESDTVARLGGDEFVIILPDSNWQGANAFAERLREKVRASTFGPPGAGMSITISIGLAVGEGKLRLEPDRLLSEADHALYEAKASGRDRVSTTMPRRSSSSTIK